MTSTSSFEVVVIVVLVVVVEEEEELSKEVVIFPLFSVYSDHDDSDGHDYRMAIKMKL